jgi:predicted regulator of Ras-like GTPase activity (Roadblock/LC7/MglB family)
MDMVFKNINRIKNALPEVKHVAMFYDNGTIFQTTFEQDINIPKLGENLAEVLNNMRQLYDICRIKLNTYEKIIFETNNLSIMILKLGEESNIALFFEKEEDETLKISAIRRYLAKIEDLVDMDRNDILFQEILSKEEELKKNQEKLKIVETELKGLEIEDIKQNDQEKIALNSKSEQLNIAIEKITNELDLLKSKIHKKN